MSGTVSRREMLQGLLAAGVALGADWPALAQGEEVVPFTDLPAPAAGRVPAVAPELLHAERRVLRRPALRGPAAGRSSQPTCCV